MARSVFTSFHFDGDYWRAQQVRNMGKIQGQVIANQNRWEELKRTGDAAVKRWIDDNMKGKSCCVVLIGSQTAGRKWINYEIEKAWGDGKGVLGIYIHKLTDSYGRQSTKGRNPFSGFNINGKDFATIVPTYDPRPSDSKQVYNDIANNLGAWIENAIAIRKRY